MRSTNDANKNIPRAVLGWRCQGGDSAQRANGKCRGLMLSRELGEWWLISETLRCCVTSPGSAGGPRNARVSDSHVATGQGAPGIVTHVLSVWDYPRNCVLGVP